MRAIAAAVVTFLALVVVLLVVVPMILTAAWGPNLTPNNTCWAPGQSPDAGITLIGRCARGA